LLILKISSHDHLTYIAEVLIFHVSSLYMSDFSNIKFEIADGIYFYAYVAGEERSYFLSLSLLENMAQKQAIDNQGVALTLFHAIRSRVFPMCIAAYKESPIWPIDKPLALLKKHIR
jgi:hypothetical protein